MKIKEIEKLKSELEEIQKREEELKLKVEELSDFLENGSLPLHWVNGEGIITWANNAELELLGYSKNEYIGHHINEFHADRNIIDDILDRLNRNETLHNYPAKLKAKDDSIKDVLINSNVLWNKDEFVHTRCFTRDITELRREQEKKEDLLRQLEEKNEQLKSAFEDIELKVKFRNLQLEKEVKQLREENKKLKRGVI